MCVPFIPECPLWWRTFVVHQRINTIDTGNGVLETQISTLIQPLLETQQPGNQTLWIPQGTDGGNAVRTECWSPGFHAGSTSPKGCTKYPHYNIMIPTPTALLLLDLFTCWNVNSSGYLAFPLYLDYCLLCSCFSKKKMANHFKSFSSVFLSHSNLGPLYNKPITFILFIKGQH